MIAFYNSSNGDGWNDNSGWKKEPLDTDGFAMPGSENDWYGITISGDSGGGSSSGGGGGGCFISMATGEPFVAESDKTAGDSCGLMLVMMPFLGSVCIYSGFRVLVNRKDL